MVKKRQESFKLNQLKKPNDLIISDVSCLLNSIIILVHNLQCNKKISNKELENLFGYNSSDGIFVEKNQFQRLNKKLKNNGGVCRLSHKCFTSKDELLYQLEKLKIPVPVYFDIDILSEISPKIKETTNIELNTGNLGSIYGNHILLLVGYGNLGDDLYFIDPNYMLPKYDEEDLKSLSKIIILNTDKFWQYVSKPVKQYIQIKCTSAEKKKLDRGLKKWT